MDTRLKRRIGVDLQVILGIDESLKQGFNIAEGNRFAVKALDISLLGIGIISKWLLPKGLVVDLEVDTALLGTKKILS